MPINRGAWAEYLRPGARKAFRDDYPSRPTIYTQIFNVLSSTRAFEEDLVAAGFGTVGLKPEMVDVPLDEPLHRGLVRYVHDTYGLGFEISREMTQDNLYPRAVPNKAQDLSMSMRDGEERIAHAVLNLAFSTQQAYDGVSLINTAHTTGLGPTQSNRPSPDVDLSVAALQAAYENFLTLTNDRDMVIRVDPKMILVHPSNYFLIHEILGSEFAPFTADNTKNILAQQGYAPIVSQYLTDSDAWFVLADKGTHKLNFFWRQKPMFEDDIDQRATVALFMVTARFSAGSSDWRGIYGSSGA